VEVDDSGSKVGCGAGCTVCDDWASATSVCAMAIEAAAATSKARTAYRMEGSMLRTITLYYCTDSP
jgi:hypothetical protein